MARIAFDLISPEKLLLSVEADMVTVPGTEGYFGVLAGHAPLVSTLRPGLIEVKGGAKGDLKLFVRGGFAEVNPERIIVLAEEAIPLNDFNLDALDQRIRDAEEELVAAQTDAERDKAGEHLDSLRQLRSIF